MAKVHFFYSTMNAGKSTALLQSNYNYQERGMQTLLLTPKVDADANKSMVHSRIGLEAPAIVVDADMNIFEYVSETIKEKEIACVLVDEVQFFSKQQVRQLCQVSDILNIPAMCLSLIHI